MVSELAIVTPNTTNISQTLESHKINYFEAGRENGFEKPRFYRFTLFIFSQILYR